jgi:hypothetical protein
METVNETIAQEALRLLSPIPAEDFITDAYSNGVDKCCGIGHYQRLKRNPNDYSLENCTDLFRGDLRESTYKFIMEKHGLFYDLSSVNNCEDINGYTQPEIKDRVIALLEDMVKAGY